MKENVKVARSTVHHCVVYESGIQIIYSMSNILFLPFFQIESELSKYVQKMAHGTAGSKCNHSNDGIPLPKIWLCSVKHHNCGYNSPNDKIPSNSHISKWLFFASEVKRAFALQHFITVGILKKAEHSSNDNLSHERNFRRGNSIKWLIAFRTCSEF